MTLLTSRLSDCVRPFEIMPALPKEKLIKRVQTPTRVHPRSLTNTDVKRLGPSRRISSKRVQTQSIQTQTALACLMLNDKFKHEGTQTSDESPADSFSLRLVKFFGGTFVSFMKLFNNFK